MAIHAVKSENFRRANPQSMQVTTMPAPVGGMDSRQNLAESDPRLCIYSYNLIPAEYGMRCRQGYRDWATGLDSGFGVTTLIPFTRTTAGPTGSRLFAVTNEGIYDATVEGATPSLMVAFPVTIEGAGYGVYTHYTTEAETDIIFYADELNGLYEFDPLLDTWVQTTGLIGVDPALINFVVSHKQRIWFTVRESTVGYYLPVGGRTGEVFEFYFGSLFKHGGDLIGLYNWSVDGGAGVDDYLVALSRGGDVIPYQGSDPEVEWSSVGTFFIGAIPRGIKAGTEYGGDLAIISEFGVTAMSDLLKSSDPSSPELQSITYKIASLIRADVRELSNERGWEIRHIPSEGLMVINIPQALSGRHLQYVLSRTTKGWCYWRDVPMACLDAWQGAAMVGTADGRVLRMDVSRDDVATEEPVRDGVDIEFSILFDFSSYGSSGRFKRGELVRPTFVGEKLPTFTAQLVYDYDINELLPPSTFPVSNEYSWNSAIWDQSIWASGNLQTQVAIRGASGIGRTMAVAMKGRAVGGTVLANVDVMWRDGGIL